LLRKILSFFWPLTNKVKSEINGNLEITWYQGIKKLDSKNANYSYGSLDNVWRFILKKIPINKNDKILILGLGGGNLVHLVNQKSYFNGKITAVEIDPVIINIAKNEFNTKYKNLTIFCLDAADFVAKTKMKFDYVFVDIFIDNMVPNTFYKVSFWKNLLTILSSNGKFVFNSGINIKETPEINKLIDFLKNHVTVKKFKNVNSTNFMIYGIKK
jgi:spermidine synthase